MQLMVERVDKGSSLSWNMTMKCWKVKSKKLLGRQKGEAGAAGQGWVA